MDIDVSQRCLGEVDVDALRDRILEQPAEAWMEQALRQQSYEVHRDTQSIVMLFCDEEWPASGGIYPESGHDRLADVAQPIIDHIINTKEIGTLVHLLGFWAAAIFLRAGGGYLSFYNLMVFRQRMVISGQLKLLKHILRLPVSYFSISLKPGESICLTFP